MGNCQGVSTDGEESEGELALVFGSPRGQPSLTRQTALVADAPVAKTLNFGG